MKIPLYSAIFLVSAVMPVFAAPDTAYQALRIIGSQRGQDILKHVVEVDGHSGVPQPVVWRVVIDDPSARGGIREIDIAHDKIVAEHTPVYASPVQRAPIDITKLNLDSSGAFAVVEKEAQSSKIGFDSVDYTLHNGDPVWEINMMDGAGHSVGAMTVAASSGEIVARNFGGQPAPDTTAQSSPPPDFTASDTDHDNVYTNPDEPPPQRQADDTDTEDTHGLRIGHRIKTAILAAGQSLKNFVTGNSGNSGN
jgi:hypothetical protein